MPASPVCPSASSAVELKTRKTCQYMYAATVSFGTSHLKIPLPSANLDSRHNRDDDLMVPAGGCHHILIYWIQEILSLKVKSKALEVNLADYHVEVAVDAKYAALQDTMARYYGLTEGLNVFLKELSHPYRNWRFIVVEARRYSLEYYHLIRNHSRGAEAARLLMDVFLEVIESAEQPEVQSEAVDNLLLFVQKIVKESGDAIEAFLPVTHDTFNRIYGFSDDLFLMFVRSYYGINRLTAACREATSGVQCDFSAVNHLLLKYLLHTYDYWLKEEDPRFCNWKKR